MMLKIKDKVTIKSDLEVGQSYNNIAFTKDMEQYKGKDAVIENVLKADEDEEIQDIYGYILKVDGKVEVYYLFSDDMLERRYK